MGVKGLLPCLQPISRPTPLDRYRGLSVAVDAMAWMHKGLFVGDVRSLAKFQWLEKMTSEELRPGSGTQGISDEETVSRRLDFSESKKRVSTMSTTFKFELTGREREAAIEASSKVVSYTIRYAEILREEYSMDVVLVVDGAPLPAKSRVDAERRSERKEAFRKALLAESSSKDSRIARRMFARACSVTQEMRHELVTKCRGGRIPFVVAPYEADAQMAKLAHGGAVDLVITEDSDLLAYGCPRVLFKLDFETRRGEEVQLMRDLASVGTGRDGNLSFRHWTHDMFVYMCILAGCDYCKGVDGVGIKTAHKIVRMSRTPKKIFSSLLLSGRSLPDDYEENFQNAYRTFRHQRVYCAESSTKGSVDTLLPVDSGLECVMTDDTKCRGCGWDFLGPWIEPEVARGVAEGELHPVHKIPWDKLALRTEDYASVTASTQDNVHNLDLSDSNGRTWNARAIRDPRRFKQVGKGQLSTLTGSGKENELFSFFSKDKKHKSEREIIPNEKNGVAETRPPLQEIYINDNSVAKANIFVTGEKYAWNAADKGAGKMQPIPMHFEEYKSTLVGTNFETLTRRGRNSGVMRKGAVANVVYLLRAQEKRLGNRKRARSSGGGGEGKKRLSARTRTGSACSSESSRDLGEDETTNDGQLKHQSIKDKADSCLYSANYLQNQIDKTVRSREDGIENGETGNEGVLDRLSNESAFQLGTSMRESKISSEPAGDCRDLKAQEQICFDVPNENISGMVARPAPDDCDHPASDNPGPCFDSFDVEMNGDTLRGISGQQSIFDNDSYHSTNHTKNLAMVTLDSEPPLVCSSTEHQLQHNRESRQDGICEEMHEAFQDRFRSCDENDWEDSEQEHQSNRLFNTRNSANCDKADSLLTTPVDGRSRFHGDSGITGEYHARIQSSDANGEKSWDNFGEVHRQSVFDRGVMNDTSVGRPYNDQNIQSIGDTIDFCATEQPCIQRRVDFAPDVIDDIPMEKHDTIFKQQSRSVFSDEKRYFQSIPTFATAEYDSWDKR